MKTLKKILFLGLAVLVNCFIGGTLSALAQCLQLCGCQSAYWRGSIERCSGNLSPYRSL